MMKQRTRLLLTQSPPNSTLARQSIRPLFPNKCPTQKAYGAADKDASVPVRIPANDCGQELSGQAISGTRKTSTLLVPYFPGPFLLPSDSGIPCKLLTPNGGWEDQKNGEKRQSRIGRETLNGPHSDQPMPTERLRIRNQNPKNPYQSFFERSRRGIAKRIAFQRRLHVPQVAIA